MDTTAWESFATGVNGAQAIGGPTLEMFVASWNAKEYSTTLYCNKLSSTGYYIGDKDILTTSKYINKDGEGLQDTLYYPHREKKENCYGYWLASPATDGINGFYYNMMNVIYSGAINYSYNSTTNYTYSNMFCLRPLVCLPETVKGVRNTDGIWIIE